MLSWSGNFPFEPVVVPLPLNVEICVRPVCCQVKPPSVDLLRSSAMSNGDVKSKAWQTKYATLPSGLKATTGSPPASYAPVPATFGSFVNDVMPGRKPFGNVGVHVLPPSDVAFTAQPSL